MRKDENINKEYNRLIIISRDFERENLNKGKRKRRYYWCKCSCGNKELKSIELHNIKTGHTKSCGCLNKENLSQKKYNTYDLTGNYGIGYTLKNEPFYFDLEDYDLIKDYCWYINKDGYVLNKLKYKSTRMHRLITNCPDDMEVDHIFHKNYDNRKSQLRICTSQENKMNRKAKGITFDKLRNKWIAQIAINYKNKFLGYFDTEEEAREERIKAEKEYFGEFAYNRGVNNEE